MAKKSQNKWQRFVNNLKRSQKLQVLIVFILLFAGLGSYHVYKSYAASPMAMCAPHGGLKEAGSLPGGRNVAVCMDGATFLF